MFLLYTSFILIGLASNGFAQPAVRPEEYCDTNLFPKGNKTFPAIVSAANLVFQATYEKNIGSQLTETILEIFDPSTQVVIATQTLVGNQVKTYSYYSTNELLAVFGYMTDQAQCQVLNLKDNIQLTPFYLVEKDGKLIPTSPLSYLFNNSDYYQFGYLGDSNFVRGIPVIEWITCDFNDGKTTSKITYSFSNPNLWTPASINMTYNSIPVQILYENLNNQAQTISTVTYTITEFRPFIDSVEEEFAQPVGVYCPGKKSYPKPVPELSFSFEYSESKIISENVDDMIGSVQDSLVEYNYDLNLFKIKSFMKNELIEELHDFNTGLNYQYYHETGLCTVSNLTAGSSDVNSQQPDKLRIKTPSEFFDFEGSQPQYAGLRRIEGVNADVWIGTKNPRNQNDQNATYEWYFLSDKWNRPDFRSKLPVPISLTVTNLVQVPDKKSGQRVLQKSPSTSFYQHFHHVPLAVKYDMIVKNCLWSLEEKRFSFSINRVQSDLIRKFSPEFKSAVLKALSSAAKVTFVRITNIEVIFDEYSVYVLFVLRDRVSSYGVNVDVDMPDVDFMTAVENLKTNFQQKMEIILLLPDEVKEARLEVVAGSFNELNIDGKNVIYQNVSRLGYNDGSVFFVIVFASLNGLAFGLLISMMHKFDICRVPFIKS